MHEVLVNRLGGLSLPRKSVVRLTDRPDMTLDVYRGRKITNQQINKTVYVIVFLFVLLCNTINHVARRKCEKKLCSVYFELLLLLLFF